MNAPGCFQYPHVLRKHRYRRRLLCDLDAARIGAEAARAEIERLTATSQQLNEVLAQHGANVAVQYAAGAVWSRHHYVIETAWVEFMNGCGCQWDAILGRVIMLVTIFKFLKVEILNAVCDVW